MRARLTVIEPTVMLPLPPDDEWQKVGGHMRRLILLAIVVPFAAAFLGGALAISLMAPYSATASASQAPEVRASTFVLVGADGTTEIGRWAPGPGGGGNLALRGADGTLRFSLSAGGQIASYGPDGTTLTFRAGTSTEEYTGAVPVNGILLGPGGSVSMLPTQ